MNGTKQKGMSVPVPPRAEQDRLMANLESRPSVVRLLEQELELAIARAERLRQSILKRAFEGRLVPQDPEDQPALVQGDPGVTQDRLPGM